MKQSICEIIDCLEDVKNIVRFVMSAEAKGEEGADDA